MTERNAMPPAVQRGVAKGVLKKKFAYCAPLHVIRYWNHNAAQFSNNRVRN